jgi:hypothetical protein
MATEDKLHLLLEESELIEAIPVFVGKFNRIIERTEDIASIDTIISALNVVFIVVVKVYFNVNNRLVIHHCPRVFGITKSSRFGYMMGKKSKPCL